MNPSQLNPPQLIESIPLIHPLERGTKLTSLLGETAHDGENNEVKAEPGARGTIVAIDRRDSGYIYQVSFGEGKPEIFLSPQEVNDDTKYVVDRPAFFSLTFNRNGRRYALRALYQTREEARNDLPRKQHRQKSESVKVFCLTPFAGQEIAEWLMWLKQPKVVIDSILREVDQRISKIIRSMLPKASGGGPLQVYDETHDVAEPAYAMTLEQLKRMQPPPR